MFAQAKDTSFIVYYSTNQYRVDSGQYYRFISFLNNITSVKSVAGYADTVGKKSYNYQLSKKRADEVVAIISGRHVTMSSKPAYLGEDHPQAKRLFENRRVEVLGEMQNQPPGTTTAEKNEVISRIILNNIYFVPDRAQITEESLPYIDELANQLKTAYKSNDFEIVGHVNYQGNRDSAHLQDLYWLSERRARTVYNLLIEKGIPSSKMFYKGVGNSQPVIANPSNEDEQRKNMRVEVIILKGS